MVMKYLILKAWFITIIDVLDKHTPIKTKKCVIKAQEPPHTENIKNMIRSRKKKMKGIFQIDIPNMENGMHLSPMTKLHVKPSRMLK